LIDTAGHFASSYITPTTADGKIKIAVWQAPVSINMYCPYLVPDWD